MKPAAAALALVLLLLAGCASSGRVELISMRELSAYREARLLAETRGRVVATLRAPALRGTPPDSLDNVLREAYRARGRALGVRAGLRLVEHYPLESLGLWVYVYRADSERALQRGMDWLEAHPDIDNVQRDSLYRTRGEAPRAPAAGADPLGPLQPIPAAELDRIHEIATGAGVLVAVIDTGVDLAHEDLAGARLQARNMVAETAVVPPEAHGTAVTGIILAQPDNSAGISGIAPGAEVLALRACWQEPVTGTAFCNTFTLAKALSAALQSGADIVNLSLTGPLDPLLGRLVADLVANGVVVVAANPDEQDQGPFPAQLPGVIAATARPLLADNPGPLFAPGTGVITLLPQNRYGLRDGSSISAAQLSAVFCLFLQHDPGLSADALESLVRGEYSDAAGLEGLAEALQAVAGNSQGESGRQGAER